MIDLKKYLDAFASEAEELIQTMNSSLLELEKNPADKETLNQLFRCAHSIKGMAATMGFSQIADLAHSMESLMDGLRSGSAKPATGTFTLLFECADALEKSIKSVAAGGAEADTAELAARIGKETATQGNAEEKKEGQPQKQPAEKTCAPAEQTGKNEPDGAHSFSITVSLKEGCEMKPLKFELVKARLSQTGRIAKEEKKTESRTEYLLLTDQGMKKAEADAESVSGVEKAEVRIYAGPEIKKKSGQSEQRIEQPAHIKVPVQRLDNLVNLAGELTTAKIRIMQLMPENSPALAEAVSTLERLSTDMQNEVMLARMVPAEQILGKFPRMVRDLAKAEGKETNLTVEGGEIELDRSVLDRIGEPLVHLLRNAVDHGIETPEERGSRGKPAAGNIKLSARREKNSIIIEVSDDGRGLDPDEIRRTALEKKVADKGEISKMDEKDVPWLMFRPGFSTTKKLTEVSGRGVGLNIVKTTTESMGGTIDIESERGKGCRFTLRLPVSLAIVPSLIVEAGSENYAIPVSCVQYVHKTNKSEIRTIQKRKAIILEGEAVPLLGLHEIFNTESSGEEATVLVIRKGREKAGLAVDRIIGEQGLMIKPLEQANGFSGAGILPNGRVVLMPDIYGLI